MSKKEKILFLIIFSLGIFLRVYKLYSNPSGIHVDEAGMFVDANMLVNYGTDRYDNAFPIYFTNFGGGQSIMYGYITAFLIKIFGCRYSLIRIPQVFFGIVFLIYSYKIGKQFMSTKKSLLLMALAAFCPYFIQASRIGLDCNLLLPFSTIALYYFIMAIKKENNYLFLISGIVYGLSLYTYALSYIIIPFLLLVTIIYLSINKRINIKQIMLLIIPIIIISIPLVLFILVNYGIINEFKFLFFGINKLPNFRNSEIGFNNIIDNILMIVSLLSHDFLKYNSTVYFGTIYYISIPILIYGLVKFIKNFKKYNLENIVLINFISTYIVLLFISNININKANPIYFSIIYIIVYGINQIKNKKIMYSFLALFIASTISFNIYYFNSDTSDKMFDKTIYKIINNNYEILKDKKIILETDTREKEIFEELGKIKYLENEENSKKGKVYIIEETMIKQENYSKKNMIKLDNYYLIY